MITGSAGEQAMAYAPEAAAVPAPRARAMGLGVRQAMASEIVPAAHNTTVVAKAGAHDPMMSGAQRLDSPWLRAAMLTPSVSAAMTTTRFGAVDPRPFVVLLRKPEQAVAMTFSDDPASGMTADRFTGSAVVFVATATFVRAQTASLD
jgi:hypothetical protein